MIASMTGYGRGEAAGSDGRFTVEIRSVNHRFSDIRIRLPREFAAWEDEARRLVGEAVHRGRVEVAVSVEAVESRLHLRVDTELAAAYHQALTELAGRFNLAGTVTLENMVNCPDLFQFERAAHDLDRSRPQLETALRAALADLVHMRRQEGQALASDFSARLDKLDGLAGQIETFAPQVVDAYRRRLEDRLAAVSSDSAVDPDRLAAELVLFADRASVTEELVRLRSHLDQLRAVVEGGAAGAVGRKLDFLLQEVNREVNTITSKAQGVGMSAAGVEMKTEVENLREQAQNIE
ncbi:MAG: YicC/YloC family endoribonuclease [Thermaerobacterales bacterium]